MLDVLMCMASLFLKKWAADISLHFEELSNYQSEVKSTSADIIDECVFNTHDCVYGSFIGQLFKPNRIRKTVSLQPFEMSARTRARIHNEYAMDQFRKNSLSLNEFAHCAASIQLLPCFRAKGDPDRAIYSTLFLPFCDSFLRTSIQFYNLFFLSALEPDCFSRSWNPLWRSHLLHLTQNSMKGVS